MGVFVGQCPLKEIHVGVPSITASRLLVGGGGAGGRSYCRPGGGGGGGGVVFEDNAELLKKSYNIVIGCGGVGCSCWVNCACSQGGNSCFGSIVAYGGGMGGSMSSTATGCSGCGGGSGGGGAGCCGNAGLGTSGQGNDGGKYCGYLPGGGGGYTCAGRPGCGCSQTSMTTCYGGIGGCGYQSSISGTSVWYGSGGSGGGCKSTPGECGGGCGGCCSTGTAGLGGNATTYGSGGGGGGYRSGCNSGGCGCQGVFYFSYPCACGYCVTGGNCCYVCNGNCIHRFTSNGTLTIN